MVQAARSQRLLVQDQDTFFISLSADSVFSQIDGLWSIQTAVAAKLTFCMILYPGE